MRMTALVENVSYNKGIKSKHGLSVYIETKKHKILFDLGPDKTLFHNAQAKGIDLSKIDTVILSHGHMDHGGALEAFLRINHIAKIYVQRSAFDAHYMKVLCLRVNVGISENAAHNHQIILLDGDAQIDEELSLFIVKNRDKCYSYMNDVMLDSTGKDSFLHEQNLLIHEERTALIVGCGHTGIVNVLESVKDKEIHLCVGGYHLCNPITKQTVSNNLLDEISEHLSKWKETEFYTCHCTGRKAYEYMKGKMANLHYLHCGETIQ